MLRAHPALGQTLPSVARDSSLGSGETPHVPRGPLLGPKVTVRKFHGTRQKKVIWLHQGLGVGGVGSGDCQVAGRELLTRCPLGARCWVLEMLPGARQPCLAGGDGSLLLSFEGKGKVKFLTVPELPISGRFRR